MVLAPPSTSLQCDRLEGAAHSRGASSTRAPAASRGAAGALPLPGQARRRARSEHAASSPRSAVPTNERAASSTRAEPSHESSGTSEGTRWRSSTSVGSPSSRATTHARGNSPSGSACTVNRTPATEGDLAPQPWVRRAREGATGEEAPAKSCELFRELGFTEYHSFALEGLAGLAAASNAPLEAARLLGRAGRRAPSEALLGLS